MFVEITRINQNGHKRELVVDTNEIAFLSQTEDHIDYEKPTKFEKVLIDDETGEEKEVASEWETEERFVIAFKNGKHPQFLDRENYEKLKTFILTK